MFKQIKKIMLYLWHQKTFTYSLQIFYKIQKNFSHTHTGVLVKFLMVRETNSVVGYHLLTEGHSIQLGSAGGGGGGGGGGAGVCAMPPPPTRSKAALFHLKHLYCLRRAISSIQNVCNVCNTHSYYIALYTLQ